MSRRRSVGMISGIAAGASLLVPAAVLPAVAAPRTTVRAAPVGEWLAGDLHVHTCYSHDAYCGPTDDNTGPDEANTLSGDVGERFLEAAVRGLDYLAITDHNDVRSSQDPGFATHGVIGLPAYENSLHGHAQMLGATHLFDNGDSSASAVRTLEGALHAEGGIFQANHPTDTLMPPLDATCSNTSRMGWGYGFDVVPDSIEVWNIGHYLQPPLPAGNSNDDAVRYWECWLQRGAHVAATGGSDSHWLATTAVQGPGNPTTWLFATERSPTGLLDALRRGRTSISLQSPVAGATRLALEADSDGDGSFDAIVGDTVPGGSRVRVRADGLPGAGLVRIRADGRTYVTNAVLAPGGQITFRTPPGAGWVRAELLLPDGTAQRTHICDPVVGARTTYCRDHLVVVALTSAIYLS